MIFALLLTIGLIAGWLLNETYYYSNIKQVPLGSNGDINVVKSPHDIVKDSEIEIQKDKVIIYKNGITGAVFLDTKSMEPSFGHGSTGLDIKVDNEEDIKIGDVVVYKPEWNENLLIPHRVIGISSNDDGSKIFHVKGDNDRAVEKVTFDQIKYLQIGIIY